MTGRLQTCEERPDLAVDPIAPGLGLCQERGDLSGRDREDLEVFPGIGMWDGPPVLGMRFVDLHENQRRGLVRESGGIEGRCGHARDAAAVPGLLEEFAGRAVCGGFARIDQARRELDDACLDRWPVLPNQETAVARHGARNDAHGVHTAAPGGRFPRPDFTAGIEILDLHQLEPASRVQDAAAHRSRDFPSHRFVLRHAVPSRSIRGVGSGRRLPPPDPIRRADVTAVAG